MDAGSYRTRRDVCGDWSFAFRHGPPAEPLTSIAEVERAGLCIHPCRVPGNLELDLQANGLCEEPFFALNILALRKYEDAHVWYFRRFAADVPPGHTADLAFGGIDCVAEVFLNGTLVGTCDNMLVAQLFPVTGCLAAENELVVHILPAVEAAKRYECPPDANCVAPSNPESLYVRKAPHMYGWDIMPRAVSAGIWRPVALYFRPTECLDAVYLETLSIAPDQARAELRLRYRVQTAGAPDDLYEIQCEGRCGASQIAWRQRVTAAAGQGEFSVTAPRLWWPRGRGPAQLYDCAVTLLKNGKALDSLTFRHGIRTVALERSSVTDAAGHGAFCFRVNGERIFVLGTNWVPLDAYHSRDAGRLAPALDLLYDSGCNLVRCWGGNVYESDAFFDFCDERGILVWQDFAMACALYPQDAGFQARLAAEAQQVVRRLRQHASLLLWAGDNECDQVPAWLGLQRDPNDNVLTRRVLPAVLQVEDGARPYLPSSPYIDPVAFRQGVQGLPEDHLWGPRDYFKSDFYFRSVCHFASEIGYHGCPAPDSIRKFIAPEHVWPGTNLEWILHSTSPQPGTNAGADRRIELMAKQIRALFGTVPETLAEFAFASQVTQGEAKKFFVEFFRGTKWRRTGIIWWNLLDGWPQFSDAVVDYYHVKKLAYHYLRTSQQPLCLMFREPADGVLELVASNDTRDPLSLSFRVTDVDTDAEILAGEGVAAADAVTVLGRVPFAESAQHCYRLAWTAGSASGANHYVAGVPPFSLARYQAWLRELALYPLPAFGP